MEKQIEFMSEAIIKYSDKIDKLKQKIKDLKLCCELKDIEASRTSSSIADDMIDRFKEKADELRKKYEDEEGNINCRDFYNLLSDFNNLLEFFDDY
jgi:hypothetical protein